LDTAEEPEDQTSNSSRLAEDDSNYPDLTGIDLLIETAPSDAIRLQLIEERNALMFGDSVDNYLKEIQEWYLQITTVDTSWYQYRMMSTPDSMLPPFLQGGWEWDFEMFKSSQEFLRQREEEKASLEAQAQLEEAQHAYEESLVPQPDVTGAGIPTRGELNKILQQEQHALRGWRSSPAPVSELRFISKFEAIRALEQYFLREEEGAPGDKINCLLRVGLIDFIPTAEEMNQVKKGDLFSLFYSGEPDVRRDIKQRYMTDDEYALGILKKQLESWYRLPEEERYKWIPEYTFKDIELYLQQVADWKKLTDNAPLPVGHKWWFGNPIRIERPFLYDFNQQGPLNYVPPENEAFNVASSPGFGLPLGGFGAGFLGMPAGGGGKAESSSLSLPSFPSVSLPGLGGGPSALPSPVGLGGVVGGVPTTPSVDLANIGWDGAAMPTPSLGFTGIGGGSAPTSPSRGGFGGGVTGGGGFNLGAGLGAGASATPSFAVSARIPSTDRFIPAPIGGPQADYPNIGLGTTPLNQMNAPQQSQQPQMQPQQVVRMIVNRHETISKKKLEQYVTAWLESQSRVG